MNAYFCRWCRDLHFEDHWIYESHLQFANRTDEMPKEGSLKHQPGQLPTWNQDIVDLIEATHGKTMPNGTSTRRMVEDIITLTLMAFFGNDLGRLLDSTEEI